MARYGSLSVFLTSRSRVTVTWVNSLKSPALRTPTLTLGTGAWGQASHRSRCGFAQATPFRVWYPEFRGDVAPSCPLYTTCQTWVHFFSVGICGIILTHGIGSERQSER